MKIRGYTSRAPSRTPLTRYARAAGIRGRIRRNFLHDPWSLPF